MQATIGVWSPTLLEVKLHTMLASLLVSMTVCPISANLNQFHETLFLLHPVPEVRDLANELRKIIDWISFGLNLGLKMEELETIEANYPTLQRRRIEMFEEWQKKVTPTWSAVVQALMVIGNKRLAFELAQKHGWLNISYE